MKNKIVLSLGIITFFVFNLYFFQVRATDDTLPEVTVEVNNSGLRATENQGDIRTQDNILTRVSETLLNGNNMYTSDSETENNLHGTDPGRTITGDIGCTLKTENGEPLTSLQVKAQLFINTDKEGVIDAVENALKTEISDEYRQALMSNQDILSSTYGTYYTY